MLNESELITNALMRYTPKFYQAELAVQVATIKRWQRLRAEVKRQQKEYGYGGDPNGRFA